ncbi:MAG: phosphohistidine phosphatase SixA [Pirellulales bacterium]
MPSISHLYIVRHAWAEDAGPHGDDFSRPLTKKGRKRFEKMMAHLHSAGMHVDCIATSPLVRTRETADIMAKQFGIPSRVTELDALAPGADWQELASWTMNQHVSRVAWIGHAPCVGRLVACALGAQSLAIRMRKGSVASIQIDDVLHQSGELEWLVTANVVEPH